MKAKRMNAATFGVLASEWNADYNNLKDNTPKLPEPKKEEITLEKLQWAIITAAKFAEKRWGIPLPVDNLKADSNIIRDFPDFARSIVEWAEEIKDL